MSTQTIKITQFINKIEITDLDGEIIGTIDVEVQLRQNSRGEMVKNYKLVGRGSSYETAEGQFLVDHSFWSGQGNTITVTD